MVFTLYQRYQIEFNISGHIFDLTQTFHDSRNKQKRIEIDHFFVGRMVK